MTGVGPVFGGIRLVSVGSACRDLTGVGLVLDVIGFLEGKRTGFQRNSVVDRSWFLQGI